MTAAAGAVLDLLFGDPQGFWHPVQGIGTLISAFEKVLRRLFAIPPRREGQEVPDQDFAIRERIAGTLMVILVLAVSTGVIFFLLQLCAHLMTMFHPIVHRYMLLSLHQIFPLVPALQTRHLHHPLLQNIQKSVLQDWIIVLYPTVRQQTCMLHRDPDILMQG